MKSEPIETEGRELNEVRQRHAGNWIAAAVVERDANGQPLTVRVIADHPDRYRLRDSIPAGLDVCIFFGGGLTKDGYELAI